MARAITGKTTASPGKPPRPLDRIDLQEEPCASGETELYPHYRLRLRRRYSTVQRWLDRLLQAAPVRRLFGRHVMVAPRRGSIVLMEGNPCLHSVRPVEGGADRINIILAYDEPVARFTIEKNLDVYLYTEAEKTPSDPNYA